MHPVKSAIGGFAAGAVLMYFADPNRGRRRRAVGRDKAVANWRDLESELNKAGRDLWNRAHGAVSAARSAWSRPEADEAVLLDRVRSRIGRVAGHPHAISTRAEPGGRIILEGPVLEREVHSLVKNVRSVPGVTEVVNRLQAYREPGNVSSLQGGVPRRDMSEFTQENWTPSLRVAAGALGGAAVCAGLRYDGRVRWLGAATGAALLARAVANRPLLQMMGLRGHCAFRFEKTVHLNAPLDEVYSYWANFENFPRFMAHLKEVRDLGNGRSHWVAEGPAGIPISWDAEITRQQTNALLEWRSLADSAVDTAGVVRFESEPNGSTRVSLRMSYCPPAGMVGHAVASLFGADPKSEIDDDMIRLKSLLETGRTRAHGVQVLRQEISLAPPAAREQPATQT